MTVSPARKRGKNAILALLSKHEHGGIDNPVNSPVLSKRCRLVEKDDADSDGSDMETAAPLPLEQPQSSEYQDDSDGEDSCGSSGTGTAGPLQTARPVKSDKDVCANSSGNTTALRRVPPSYESRVRRSGAQKHIIGESEKIENVRLQISPAITREDIAFKEPAPIRSHRVNVSSSAHHTDSMHSDRHQQGHGAPNTIQLLGLLRKRKRQ